MTASADSSASSSTCATSETIPCTFGDRRSHSATCSAEMSTAWIVSPTSPAWSSGQSVPPSPAPRSASARGGERSAVCRSSGGIHSVRKYRECSRSWTLGPELLAKALPPGEIPFRIDEHPVPLDVAVLAADHAHHEIFRVARVRDLARGRRLDVQQPALADLAHLAADLDARSSAVHEVQLVLLFVEMLEPFEVRREDDCVDAESRDAERVAHLPEPRAVAELVDRAEGVAAHSFLMISSASSRVNARSVSVCSAPYWLSFIRISIA